MGSSVRGVMAVMRCNLWTDLTILKPVDLRDTHLLGQVLQNSLRAAL